MLADICFDNPSTPPPHQRFYSLIYKIKFEKNNMNIQASSQSLRLHSNIKTRRVLFFLNKKLSPLQQQNHIGW